MKFDNLCPTVPAKELCLLWRCAGKTHIQFFRDVPLLATGVRVAKALPNKQWEMAAPGKFMKISMTFNIGRKQV